ncbi:hypothetical protein PD280_21320 [Virgibacillus salarius]|uniref:hypothetical protein n=1 Tax=Virgibacillus salarius TaxID=447199 RepID=UPI002490838E|nr:hypothetical protein [Virgibacillus salarius]WBX80109.1 hypothetical protein PD280_21320 [Virgibacillus salarius]
MSNKLPKLYSKADLARRWGVSRQVVKNWELRHDNFPKPVMWVHDNSLPLYIEKDIIKYEELRSLEKPPQK